MSTDIADAEVAVFDPGVWYQLSEARVDIGGKELVHNLVIQDSPPGFGVQPNDNNYWQFVPTEDGIENRFYLRSQKSGTGFHLAVCFHEEEESAGKTRLCLGQSSTSEDQKWDTTEWNDGTAGIRFVNVENGTDWWLDCHKGGPPFMNDDIDTTEFKPAQRWLAQSIGVVEDERFIVDSAAATQPPDSSASDGGSTPTDSAEADQAGNDDSDSPGMSAGVSAGIGVGAGVVVIFIVAAVFFLMRRRKKQKKIGGGEEEAAATTPASYNGPDDEKKGIALSPVIEAPTSDTGAHEIEGYTAAGPLPTRDSPMELDATESSTQTPGSSIFAKPPANAKASTVSPL